MEVKGYNPTTFQKKSSFFGISPVNPWRVWSAYFLGNQEVNNATFLPEVKFLKVSFKIQDFRLKSTHSTPRSKARGMLRVDTERRFLPRFKNRGLAPSNVSIRCGRPLTTLREVIRDFCENLFHFWLSLK